MKSRLAMKLTRTPWDRLAPMWRRALLSGGRDVRIVTALKMIEKWEKWKEWRQRRLKSTGSKRRAAGRTSK